MSRENPFANFEASFISCDRTGEKSLISLGAKLLILPPLILLISFFTQNTHVLTSVIILAVAIGFFAAGLIIPNSYSLGVKSFLKIAGIAGAFFGFAQMFGASVYSFFISCSSSFSIFPLLMTMIVSMVISLLSVSKINSQKIMQTVVGEQG